MNRLPPRIVRRLVIAPVAVALCLSLVALSPVLLLGAVVADLVAGGGWRTVRVTTFCVVYLAFEILAIVVLFLLWIGSGFGLRIRSETSRAIPTGHRSPGHGPGRSRRIRALPRRPRLHQATPSASHRSPSTEGLRRTRGPGRADDERPSSASWRRDGSDLECITVGQSAG